MKIKTVCFGTGRRTDSSRVIPGIMGSQIQLCVGQGESGTELRSNTVPIVITSLDFDRQARTLTIRAVEKDTRAPWRHWSDAKDAEGKFLPAYECDALIISLGEHFTIFADDDPPAKAGK